MTQAHRGIMKKLIYTTAIAILSIGMISCNQPQSNRAKDTKIDTTVAANTESANSRPDQAEVKDNKNINSQSQAKVKDNSASSKSKTNSSKQTSSGKLEVGTVKRIQQGDISCYVDLVDEKGETHLSMYADFALCDEEKKFLNKKVRLSYELANLNDCQSAEPCGKTRQETIISKMEIIR
jgi:hypothetical protein